MSRFQIDSFSNHIENTSFSSDVQTGYPSRTDGRSDIPLDLNKYLIQNPVSTFFVRVSGDSMTNVGIYDNDILIVDRSLEAKDDDIVVAVLNGELTVKRLCLKNKSVQLKSENPSYPILNISEETDFLIWGVVTSHIRQIKVHKK